MKTFFFLGEWWWGICLQKGIIVKTSRWRRATSGLLYSFRQVFETAQMACVCVHCAPMNPGMDLLKWGHLCFLIDPQKLGGKWNFLCGPLSNLLISPISSASHRPRDVLSYPEACSVSPLSTVLTREVLPAASFFAGAALLCRGPLKDRAGRGRAAASPQIRDRFSYHQHLLI